MKVQNKSKRAYQHGEYKILPGCTLEVPAEVAETWIKTGEIVEYIEPAEAKAIEAENAKLKAELEQLKKAEAAKTTKKTVNKKK